MKRNSLEVITELELMMVEPEDSNFISKLESKEVFVKVLVLATSVEFLVLVGKLVFRYFDTKVDSWLEPIKFCLDQIVRFEGYTEVD